MSKAYYREWRRWDTRLHTRHCHYLSENEITETSRHVKLQDDVEKYLRAYYQHAGDELHDEYYNIEPDEIQRQHLFEAIIDILQNYEIGIKYDTSDSMIESIDPIFVYKELHKIHNIQRKN